jgi:hypothetical protein
MEPTAKKAKKAHSQRPQIPPLLQGRETFQVKHECPHTRARGGVVLFGNHSLQTPALISQSRFGSVPFMPHDLVRHLHPTQEPAGPDEIAQWGLCLPFADMLLLGKNEEWCINTTSNIGGGAHSIRTPQPSYLSARDSLQFPPYSMKETGSTAEHMVLNTSRGRVKVTPSDFMSMVSTEGL